MRWLSGLLMISLSGGCWMWESEEELRVVENQMDMERHYEQAALARDAVIRGEPKAAVEQLVALKKRLPLPAVPENLRSQESALQKVLEQGSDATTMPQAADAVAAAANACGQCHASAGVRLSSPETPPPESGDMTLHQWAASRIWDGLLSSDDETLAAAFGALNDATFVPSAMPDEALRATAAPVADGLKSLAARVAAPDTPRQERLRAYADFLELCADCHSMTGGGPKH